MSVCEFVQIEQGSPEWLDLRKTKITATDASVIMGINPWETLLGLYNKKLDLSPPTEITERMQRGMDLEPIARDLFCLTTGWDINPAVAVKDWAMASLDGITPTWDTVLEIKCPSENIHAVALSGKIPDYYYPQIQHQLYVTGAKKAYYYSFDGIDGVSVLIERDEEYIGEMVIKEKEFYERLKNRNPPDPCERDYIERHDEDWRDLAIKWMKVSDEIKQLEEEEAFLRESLVNLSGDKNTIGFGIALSKISRKGNVDYGKVPELKGVDLDSYRKASSTSWRILRK